MKDGYQAFARFVGGLALVSGFIMLFVVPLFGIVLLAIAAAIGALSIGWTRRDRHTETQADFTQTERPSGWNVRSTALCNCAATASGSLANRSVSVNSDKVRAASV